jgi:para-nitrobenzyl esterase
MSAHIPEPESSPIDDADLIPAVEIDRSNDPVVGIAAGAVRGRWRSTARAGHTAYSAEFLGIPFAEAPVGERRFAAPVPIAPWAGVRDALENGATPQRQALAEITLIPEPSVAGESTLNLNVFTPDPGGASALPVLVYIHGGGFTAGSPASPWYDGAAFNRDGVVTVSISYRLGFDGFGWIDGAPDNRGVLDWLLALEWVRVNIAAFGGDPRRVTIAGQSAGGGAVLTLLGMEGAQHLFAGVYSISGALGDVSRQRAEALARRLAQLAGVEPTRAGFATLDEERILELQQKAQEPEGDQGSPLDAMQRFVAEGLALGPMIDGVLIVRPTLDSLQRGIGADKPLTLGAADDEFSMALDGAKNKLRFIPAAFLLGKMGLTGPHRSAYLAANHDVRKLGTAAVIGRFVSDSLFRVLALRVAEARTARNADSPTWLYRFSWRSPVFGYAVHCLDVPFIFDCLDAERIDALAGQTPPQQLADEVHADAVAFVVGGEPHWPRFRPETSVAKVFDVPSSTLVDAYASVRPLLSR